MTPSPHRGEGRGEGARAPARVGPSGIKQSAPGILIHALDLAAANAEPETFLDFGCILPQLAGDGSQSLVHQRRTPSPNPLPQGRGLSGIA